jgi:hypothetical protein
MPSFFISVVCPTLYTLETFFMQKSKSAKKAKKKKSGTTHWVLGFSSFISWTKRIYLHYYLKSTWHDTTDLLTFNYNKYTHWTAACDSVLISDKTDLTDTLLAAQCFRSDSLYCKRKRFCVLRCIILPETHRTRRPKAKIYITYFFSFPYLSL